MSAQHTPGPWKVEKSNSDNGYSIISEAPDWDNQKREVAGVFMSYGLKDQERREIVAANAHLIAAAPDMLAALKVFMAEIGTISGANNREAAFLERVESLAKSAIAKAEGA